MVHLKAAEYGRVLELSLSDGSAVVADHDKIAQSFSEHLHDVLETNFWLVLSEVFLIVLCFICRFLFMT